MNIEDFKPQAISFPDIFKKQKELQFQYEPQTKEVFETFDLDCYEDQELFKKICWRITEELAEVRDAKEDPQHLKEELIDGFNFTVELFLLLGYSEPPTKEDNPQMLFRIEDLWQRVADFQFELGMTANLLKNRAWRQSQYLVDYYVFRPKFEMLWFRYLHIFDAIGMTEEDIQELWYLKYQVNNFRLQTRY